MSQSPPAAKHLLDSTILHGLLHGDRSYLAYLNREIPEEARYIVPYIRIEILRGFVCHLINFYHFAQFPQYETFVDAHKVWSNLNRSPRAEKIVAQVVLEFISILTGCRADAPEDKSFVLERFASLIFRYVRRLRYIAKETGQDRVHCGRAAVSLDWQPDNIDDCIERFKERFDDKRACRAQCRIDTFITESCTREIAIYEMRRNQMTKKTEERGFQEVIDALIGLRADAGRKYTCDNCGSIGDAVIALEAPVQPSPFVLEHTDASFNLLCDLIHKPHTLRPTSYQYLKPRDARP